MLEFSQKTGEKRRRLIIRIVVASLFILLCFGVLIYRLWILQVERYQGLSERADRNRISLVPIPPRRGDVFDRNGMVLARSYRDYTIEITPRQVKNIDETIAQLQEIIPITPLDIRRFKHRLSGTSRFDSVMIRHNITDEEAALFAAHSYRFPGISLKARWVREYPQGESAAHLIGYVGRISERDQERLEEEGREGNYRGTDVIGKKGIEASYEQQLHGKTGWEEVEVSASGRPVRVLSRTDPVPGDNLRLSIDMGLQKMVGDIFNDPKNPQRGALVAIDPKTGEVLAYVSAPSFDPNLFIDGIDVESWRQLADSEDSPLLDRPISGAFPIGSTYKPFVALAALTLGVRDAETRMPDPGYFEYGGQRFHNAGRAVYGSTNMHKALMVSSDTYFFSLGPILGVDDLHDFSQQFGFGKKTGIDLPGEKRGILPSKAWKKQAFKDPKKQTWYVGETISVTVGQGYNALTIMQLAQATSVLAADGVYMRPHIVNWLENPVTRKAEQVVTKPEYIIPLKHAHLEVIKNAMVDVNRYGTGRRAFAGAPYLAAGKTGTAQVFSLRGSRYNAQALNKRLHDHALYMGFAPANNPQVAVALIVENGGKGASVAAPIARKVFDYWLSPNRMQAPEYVSELYEEGSSEEVSPDVEVPAELLRNPEDKLHDEATPDILGLVPTLQEGRDEYRV